MKTYSLFSFLLVFILNQNAWSQSVATENEATGISVERYRAGAATGTLVGFGLGHKIQKRPKEGLKFLIGEAAPLTLFVGSLMLFEMTGGDTPTCTSGEAISNPDKCPTRHNPLATMDAVNFFAAVFLGFKVWETVDLWSYDYKGTSNQPSTSFLITPMPDNRLGGMFVYSF